MGFPPLAERYAAFLFDLDGVLYRGDEGVPGAAETVRDLRAAGRRAVFLTNNSSRTTEDVAAKLSGLGIPADPGDVVTSALAVVGLLEGVESAFVIGEEGIRRALTDAGIRVLDGAPEAADAVVVGWDRSAGYDAFRTAGLLVQRGARLVATNADASYPAPGGELWPGAGALLAAVETTTGRRAKVAGKPEEPLFAAALGRAGVEAPAAIVVGDRVETDVVGAVRAGIDAAAVLSGASDGGDLLSHDEQPVAFLADATGLLTPRPLSRVRPAGGVHAEAVRTLVEGAGLAGEGPPEEAIVTEDGDRVVATASAAVREGEGYLHSVVVVDEARGAGLGTLAVAAAVRRAAASGARAVALVTEDAAGFFGRLGFEPVDRDALPGWMVERSRACSGSATAMRRQI